MCAIDAIHLVDGSCAFHRRYNMCCLSQSLVPVENAVVALASRYRHRDQESKQGLKSELPSNLTS